MTSSLWHTPSGRGLAGLDYAHGGNAAITGVSFLDPTTLATSDGVRNSSRLGLANLFVKL